LLGHEGEGSLLSALKARSWCNSLLSGKRPGARGFNFFSVLVDLTEEGIKHIDDIIQLMFQYIDMLKSEGPIEWIYDVIVKIKYNYVECSANCTNTIYWILYFNIVYYI